MQNTICDLTIVFGIIKNESAGDITPIHFLSFVKHTEIVFALFHLIKLLYRSDFCNLFNLFHTHSHMEHFYDAFIYPFLIFL